MNRPSSSTKYFTILALSYITLITLHLYALHPHTPTEKITFLMISITLIPISYITTEAITLLHKHNKPLTTHRKTLTTTPKTAIIQPIYNDFQPEKTLENKQNNPQHDYWILSDSTNPENIKHEDQFCLQNNINMFRRENRTGKKAGAINDWSYQLNKQGYEYYMVLDKDSSIEPETVNRLLEIAEHPNNQSTAIFQTIIKSREGETKFSKMNAYLSNVLVELSPVNDMKWMGRAMYWGHNALIRSKAFQEVGGEDEQYLSEDFAFCLKLEEAGWDTVLVPEVVSYEEQPPDFLSSVERSSRWMRGSYGLMGLAIGKIGRVSFSSVFMVLLSSLFNLSNVALSFVLLLVLGSPGLFVNGVSSEFMGWVSLFLSFYVVIILNVLPVFAIVYKGGLCGVGGLVRVLVLNSLISMVMVFRCFVESVRFLVLRDFSWVPMRVEGVGLSLGGLLRRMFVEVLVGLLILGVCFVRGDFVGLMFFSPWIVAFVFSPLTVYITSKK